MLKNVRGYYFVCQLEVMNFVFIPGETGKGLKEKIFFNFH